jgi:hypothetical protein
MAVACFVLAVSGRARADVSSWLFLGTGPSWVREGESRFDSRTALQLDTGMGTPSRHAIIVGGLGRFQTHFGRGTDLALLLRTATHGFVNGGWGGALDLGGYWRSWEAGSTGATGSLVLGAPWGVTLSVGASFGPEDARTYSTVLGIDFARLTIYRKGGPGFWPNPFHPDRDQTLASR